MAFGTFDIFHPGHRNFLKQAGKFGGRLIVVVGRDRTVLKVKKKLPANKENKRLKVIKESNLADEAVLGNLRDKYKIIRDFKPDIVCLGYDQKYFAESLKEKLEKFGLRKTKIIRLKPYKPQIYKSSKLKEVVPE